MGDVSDVQVQAILDSHRVRQERLPVVYEYRLDAGGDRVYTGGEVVGRWGSFEPATQASAWVVLEDSDSAAATGNWTLSEDGRVEFASDQTDAPTFYVTGYTYDIKSAAAEVVEQLIGLLAQNYDVKLGDQSFSRSQAVDHLERMLVRLRRAALARTATLVRSDQEPSPVVGVRRRRRGC